MDPTAKTVKITLDGREVEVREGQTILQAAEAHGRSIPHYCYHEGLSIAGNCRMCLVEVEKAPKLVIACYTPVQEGMVVSTESERVKQAQSAVMEFLLINHPLDCPICDQAGECRLQDYAVAYGGGASRYVEPKQSQAKAVDIGRHVMLDQERCIQCSRCTRFCDEITGTRELDFFQRGNRTVIGLHPGRRLDNPYSANVADICPVGALTLKEFRFQTRVWYLNDTPSICAACARGCNVMLGTGRQNVEFTSPGQFDDRIKRMVPRANEAVNGHWMCDEGRLSFRSLHAGERVETARMGSTPKPWREALAEAAGALRDAAGAGRAAALFSPRLTVETLFAWREVLRRFGNVKIGVPRIERGGDDDLLIRADRGANSRGAAWVFGERAASGAVLESVGRGEIDTLLLVGDPLDAADDPALDEPARSQLRRHVYVGPFLSGFAADAAPALPAAAWSEEEGHLVNFEGRIQRARRCRLPQGEGRPGWRVAADLAAAAGAEGLDWSSLEEVFAALAEALPEFQGLGIDDVGPLGVPGRAGAATG